LKSTKPLRIALILSFIVVVFVSSGVVSALNASDASATAYWSTGNEPLTIGTPLFVRINFQSNIDQQLQVDRIGVNFDWMNETDFYGVTLSSPKIVEANSSYISNPILFEIPFNVTAGKHNYHIGVDGTDASGATFQWDSPTVTVNIGYANSGTTPTPTATQSGDGGTATPQNWTLYIAVIAVVAIGIAVAFIFIEIWKKPKKPVSATESPTPPAESPKPADKPTPATDQPLKDIEE
jgi:hypothetical protein